MKTFMTALATAILIAGLVLTPAAAAPSSSSTCGDSYTVQHLDNMFKIAMKCGLTVADIIYFNPQITNPNVIRSGQVLRLTPTAGYTVTYYNKYGEKIIKTYGGTYTGNPLVNLSVTTGEGGDEIVVNVSGFPANSWVDYRIGQEDEDYTEVYDGTINSKGEGEMTITIPYEADYGEYWVVQVLTTSQKDGVEAFSARIYIDG